jgi:pSer/pThr/pTyr-binding forkhead associated (FHA) protein
MRVRCTHCSAQVDLDDRQYAGRRMAQIRCWMCAQSSLVDLMPLDMNSTTMATDPLESSERPFAAARLAESSKTQTATLDLPLGKSITISVIDGPSSGFQRDLTMPLVTLGRLRGGADIEIDDPQVSRLHCAIEVKNDTVFLRDLRSTNGTYVAGRRVLAAKLDACAEFRIGVSALRVDIASH